MITINDNQVTDQKVLDAFQTILQAFKGAAFADLESIEEIKFRFAKKNSSPVANQPLAAVAVNGNAAASSAGRKRFSVCRFRNGRWVCTPR